MSKRVAASGHMIHGERLRQARELRGLTQTELADRLAINQSTIAYIENGRLSPSDELVNSISLQTGFPPAFFRRAPAGEFSLGSLLFRSRASTTTKEETTVRRYGQTIFELIEILMSKVRPIKLRLPMLDEYNSPEDAAKLARAAIGLSPDTPIRHLTHALELAGMVVIALPVEISDIDAFSLWAGRSTARPVIVVSDGWPGDRVRFSLAHELGHLILHQSMAGNLKEVEREANRFAGEFLLPEMPMMEELAPPITLSSLPEMKVRWGVSMQSLIMRARELRIITDRQRTYLFQQLSSRGWKRQEPAHLAIPVERPRALRQLAEAQYGVPISYEQLAADTCLPTALVRDCLNVCSSALPMKETISGLASDAGRVLQFRAGRQRPPD